MSIGGLTEEVSGYTNVDASEDPSRYIQRLDAVGSSAFWSSIRRAAREALSLKDGDHALEVGCGTGDEVLAMAEYIGRRGRAVGVDISAVMIQEARCRAERSGSPAEFIQASAHCLPFASHSFDACRVERVLQHLDNPEHALAEAVRTARPGARVVVVEPDYTAHRIEGADPGVTERILKVRCARFRAPSIGRRVPRILRDLGVVGLTVTPEVFATTDFAAQREFLREKYVLPAQDAGVVSSAEANHWLEDLAKAASEGRYRHTVVVYRVRGYIH